MATTDLLTVAEAKRIVLAASRFSQRHGGGIFLRETPVGRAFVMAAQAKTAKKPRHITITIRHMVEQRDKAIAVRDRAVKEVEELDAALLALGWPEEE